jgi:hypothetical protein
MADTYEIVESLKHFENYAFDTGGHQMRDLVTSAAATIVELAEALEKIASPHVFASGTIDTIAIDYEGIAREFNNRQKIARSALSRLKGKTNAG